MNPTNSQLCLIIGIPTLAIILSRISSHLNINRIAKNIDKYIALSSANTQLSPLTSSKEPS